MPFYNVSEIPNDTKWSRVTSEDIKDDVKGTEVYDLTWIEKTYENLTLVRKWRVFVNSKTNLPQKVEGYKQLATSSEYILISSMTIEYLSDDEIESFIKKASF
jgi:hypothetical protein